MRRIVSRLLILPLIALVAVSVGAATAAAQTATGQTASEPTVYLSSPVTSMLVDKGKQVSIEIDVWNKTGGPRFVNLELVEAPEGWETTLTDRGFVARSVFARPDGLESVDMKVKVPAEAKEQDYKFVIKGSGEGFETSWLTLTVGVKDKATQATSLVVQYPTLQGKSGSEFEFKADLRNDSEEERSYGLSFKAPEGWGVSFKPSYEDKQISSVRIKSGSSQGLDVEVTPPSRVEAGEYPISLTASSGSDQASSDLKVGITGSYDIAMSTRGDIFNTQATAGQESPFYITVFNTGSAPLTGLSLSSYKPEGWKVTFKPETIDSLEPGGQREVAMMIAPAAKAIAGDYMLNVMASHPQASMDRDIRVTVETPTIWGFVGVGLLVLVIGGMMGLFMKLGRR